ncbi:MAG: uroporphyrinogen-III synthase [Myxococcales bacterium]|nr:uroporphyrinogen-III synthase [Myxococcales bacterium]
MLELVRTAEAADAEPIDRALTRARSEHVVRLVGLGDADAEIAAAVDAGVELLVRETPEPQHLRGKRVLVTRAAHQARETVRGLRRRGAEPLELPTILIGPPEDPAPLAAAAADPSRWDVIALTSENGVEAFFTALAAAHHDARALAGRLVAVIGPGTARALERHGVRPDLVAEEHRGEALAEAIVKALGPRCAQASVLLPRAAVARDALPDALRAVCARVDVIEAYRTRAPDASILAALRATLEARRIDVVLFTASSTVQNLCTHVPDAARLLTGVVVATIGPITSEACARAGIPVTVEASPYTVPSLLAALERHFAGTPNSSS